MQTYSVSKHISLGWRGLGLRLHLYLIPECGQNSGQGIQVDVVGTGFQKEDTIEAHPCFLGQLPLAPVPFFPLFPYQDSEIVNGGHTTTPFVSSTSHNTQAWRSHNKTSAARPVWLRKYRSTCHLCLSLPADSENRSDKSGLPRFPSSSIERAHPPQVPKRR